jgi:hypothetical protein
MAVSWLVGRPGRGVEDHPHPGDAALRVLGAPDLQRADRLDELRHPGYLLARTGRHLDPHDLGRQVGSAGAALVRLYRPALDRTRRAL